MTKPNEFRGNKAVIQAVREASGLDRIKTDLLCDISAKAVTAVQQSLPGMIDDAERFFAPVFSFTIKVDVRKSGDHSEPDVRLTLVPKPHAPAKVSFSGKVANSDQKELGIDV